MLADMCTQPLFSECERCCDELRVICQTETLCQRFPWFQGGGGGVGGRDPHVSDCVHETQVSVWREPRVLSISEFVALERK